jgi:3',5'-nucleoside bisphosphate phosphatase
MIDLHSHTTASDGELSAEELVRTAAAAGVRVLSVTDHDTIAGLEAAQRAATRSGIELVCGIEISIRWLGREVHILGHFVDPNHEPLSTFGDQLKGERFRRMERMLERARQLGFPVQIEDVVAIAGPAHLGRPHLARLFVERGYCTSTQEVFRRFLQDNGPVAVERFEVSFQTAVSLIHKSGGTATVAHPGLSKITENDLREMAALGLDGVEIEHLEHPPSQRAKYRAIADALGLIATAGSDFHGPKATPDRTFGKVTMSETSLQQLREKGARYQKTHIHRAANIV